MEKERVEQIKTAIQKTGFIFELEVSKKLEKNGWSVINNRYYIDEISKIQREMDILAYKTYKYEGIRFFFTLLISCKKSEKRDWVFITRDLEKSDPNLDYYPQIMWGNSKILELTEFENKLCSAIIGKCDLDKYFSSYFTIDERNYAFQEIDLCSDKPQNDKDIFSSIDSLIKSAHFEYKYLEKRKRENTFYHINLINIFHGNMYKANASNDELKIEEIKCQNYINRFIIGDEDKFYRIRFCNYNDFLENITVYDKIFGYEIEVFTKNIDEFKLKFIENSKYRHGFDKDLYDYIQFRLIFIITAKAYIKTNIERLSIEPSEDKKSIILVIESSEEIVKELNKNENLLNDIKRYLSVNCKYNGEVEFSEPIYSDDIPF